MPSNSEIEATHKAARDKNKEVVMLDVAAVD